MTFPDPNSLYSLLTKNETKLTDEGRLFHTTLDTLTQHKGLPLERYEQLKTRDYRFLSDDRVIELLFDKSSDTTRSHCIGDMSRADFEKRFDNGVGLYGENGRRVGLVFMYVSFPETYLHPRIAQVLRGSGKLAQVNSAKQRISDTALVMVQAVSDSCLATMALVAASHLIRNLKGDPNFNADTVEYTLLTFSYFGAKRSGVKEADWFFYWKVFGSLMGLGRDRLHDDYDQAARRMSKLHEQCPMPPNGHSKALLDVFIDAFDLREESNMRDLNNMGLVSKRLHAYYESEKLWPKGLARTKGVTD